MWPVRGEPGDCGTQTDGGLGRSFRIPRVLFRVSWASFSGKQKEKSKVRADFRHSWIQRRHWGHLDSVPLSVTALCMSAPPHSGTLGKPVTP